MDVSIFSSLFHHLGKSYLWKYNNIPLNPLSWWGFCLSSACLRLVLLAPVGPQTLLVHTEQIQVERYQTIFSPQQIISYLSVYYATVNQSVFLFSFLFLKRQWFWSWLRADDFTQWGLYTENDDKQSPSLSLVLSLSPSHNDTQTDTRSVPIGRTVARERCLLNVDRICCLVHFRHENNCRIWIFITRRLFMWRLYSGNISKRGRSSSCTPPPRSFLCCTRFQLDVIAYQYFHVDVK